jgi:hypothetical protein
LRELFVTPPLALVMLAVLMPSRNPPWLASGPLNMAALTSGEN